VATSAHGAAAVSGSAAAMVASPGQRNPSSLAVAGLRVRSG